MRRRFATAACWLAFACGCAVSRGPALAPDCGCGDTGGCTDPDPPDAGEGIPGWRMTWAAQAGGDSTDSFPHDLAFAVAALADGTALVSGRYGHEALFGAGEPNETLLPIFGLEESTGHSTNDFVARYDPKGELLWAKGFGGSDWDLFASASRQLDDGRIVALGGYVDQVTVGVGEPNEATLVADSFGPGGLYSHVLAWMSAEDGSLDTAVRALDASHNVFLPGMTDLPDDSVAVTGSFSEAIALAPGTPDETLLFTTGTSDCDIVLARFGVDGTLLWSAQAGGPGADATFEIVRLLDGTLAIAGFFEQTAVFGAGEPNESTLGCDPDLECGFVAGYDEDGALLWARSLGFRAHGRALPRLAAAPDGGFAVTSAFQGVAALGAGEPNETTLGPVPPEDDHDFLIARYDDDGALLWAREITGPSDFLGPSEGNTAVPVSFLDSGQVVIAGQYEGGPITLGAGEPNETELPFDNKPQIFVALLYANGNLAWAIAQGGPSVCDKVMSVDALGDDTFFVAGVFGGTVAFGTSPEDEVVLTANGDSEIFALRFDRTEE